MAWCQPLIEGASTKVGGDTDRRVFLHEDRLGDDMVTLREGAIRGDR